MISFVEAVILFVECRESACRGCESHCRGVRVLLEAVRIIIEILKVFVEADILAEAMRASVKAVREL